MRCFAGDDHRLVLKEGSLVDYYSVCLSSKPTHPVEIITNSSHEIQITPSSVIITPEEWDVVHNIKVCAMDRPGSDNTTWSTSLRHLVNSKDQRYQSPRAMIIPETIAVTVMENDAPHLFSFGDSNCGQTGLGHLDLQALPHQVDFKKAMNVPLESHETLVERYSHQIKVTTRPWHTATGGSQRSHPPGSDRPSKASTSVMLRRILQQSCGEYGAATASEEIARRRLGSKVQSNEIVHDEDRSEEGTEEKRVFPPHVVLRQKHEAERRHAEQQLLTNLFPTHKTLEDHQMFHHQMFQMLFPCIP